MATEALGLALVSRKKEHLELPLPSAPDSIQTEGGTLVVIEFNMLEYMKKHNSRAVKKTLSIPEWLNEEAIDLGLNFSQILQEALLEKIQSINPAIKYSL